jgi:hypothetical protein
MLRRHPKPQRELSTASSGPEAVSTAWHILGVQMDWSGKVDAKASFALAIESAVLAGLLALSQTSHRLIIFEGTAAKASYGLAVGFLIAGAAAAVSVVFPRLWRTRVNPDWRHSYIYFGDLRRWQPADLEKELREGDILDALARQLISMSVVTWGKHIRVGVSLGFASLGAIATLVAFLANK